MTDLLALDIASVTGFARGRIGDAAPTCGSIRFSKPGASQLAICGRAWEWIIEALKPPRPDVVAIEALLPPSVTRGRSNINHDLLAHLHGIVMAACFKCGVYKVNKHPVQSIRAHFLHGVPYGKGQGKAAVIERCRVLGWLDDPDDDAADALALWSYQAALIDPEYTIRISPLFAKKIFAETMSRE